MIQWELCKSLKLGHADKWYLYQSESILKNQTLKILQGFEIQTDHRTQAKRSQQTKESEKLNKYLDLGGELWSVSKDLEKKLVELKKRRLLAYQTLCVI